MSDRLVVWTECEHGETQRCGVTLNLRLNPERSEPPIFLPDECPGGERLVLTRPDYEAIWERYYTAADRRRRAGLTFLQVKDVVDAAGDLWTVERNNDE